MSILSQPLSDLTYVAFDTETSGQYPLQSQICEIAAVKWSAGQEVETYQTLVKPDEMMSDFVIGIHNITNEMVADAPKIGEVIGDFARFIEGSIPIAHHAPFDLGFLAPEIEQAGLPLPTNPVLCSSLLSRKLIKESSNHKLQTLIKVLNLEQGQAHRALDDARACLGVALECFSRLTDSAVLQDAVTAQGASLNWSSYSLEDLKERERTANLIKAIQNKADVSLVYQGGSRPGRARVVHPIGIVRNPNGDYLVASDEGAKPPKRYALEKISSSKLV
ncbi:MAG: 3'-5' exoribonuclease [Bdellovibrionales bacterium]|nr:3'-5' exoribonuclease [Bdellovibrionales bacterium]